MRDFQRMLDRIAYDIQRAADRVENVCQRHWASGRNWKRAGAGPDIERTRERLRRVPDRLSDLATDGSCAMRYLLGYSLKGLAALQIFGGVLTVAIIFSVEDNPWHNEGFSIGLVLIATAQLIWWAGRLVHRSADRKRYAQLQHRLLRLAVGEQQRVTEAAGLDRGLQAVERAGLQRAPHQRLQRAVGEAAEHTNQRRAIAGANGRGSLL